MFYSAGDNVLYFYTPCSVGWGFLPHTTPSNVWGKVKTWTMDNNGLINWNIIIIHACNSTYGESNCLRYCWWCYLFSYRLLLRIISFCWEFVSSFWVLKLHIVIFLINRRERYIPTICPVKYFPILNKNDWFFSDWPCPSVEDLYIDFENVLKHPTNEVTFCDFF